MFFSKIIVFALGAEVNSNPSVFF